MASVSIGLVNTDLKHFGHGGLTGNDTTDTVHFQGAHAVGQRLVADCRHRLAGGYRLLYSCCRRQEFMDPYAASETRIVAALAANRLKQAAGIRSQVTIGGIFASADSRQRFDLGGVRRVVFFAISTQNTH